MLSDLKRMLKPYQIDAQPEGQYADDKRADIRICYGSNLAIPIEIKKNSSRDLWRGITEQLVPKYTRDPKADGNGIYLVFWFGAEQKYMRIAPSEGGVPAKPEDLKRLLERGLRPTLKNKIHVVVVDVSPGHEMQRPQTLRLRSRKFIALCLSQRPQIRFLKTQSFGDV